MTTSDQEILDFLDSPDNHSPGPFRQGDYIIRQFYHSDPPYIEQYETGFWNGAWVGLPTIRNGEEIEEWVKQVKAYRGNVPNPPEIWYLPYGASEPITWEEHVRDPVDDLD